MNRRESVQNYYGKILTRTSDLKTNCCTTTVSPSAKIKNLIANVHDDVTQRYFGCGLVYPEKLEGMRVLDLGCGSGRDVFVLSQLVGPDGLVVGVDMTDEQLEVGREHINWHTERFGFPKPNVVFKKGYIEELGMLNFPENSFDIIVSNCVINLSPDKQAVFDGAFKLLSEGGEMYFSDVYSDRRVPESLVQNSVLYNECASGALYRGDFLTLARTTGFTDARLVESDLVAFSEDLAQITGHINFYSETYRLFKINALEATREDYGQGVIYKGRNESSSVFKLDQEHTFERNRVTPVCGNTWSILQRSRFQNDFEFFGDFSTHFGAFNSDGISAREKETESRITKNQPTPNCC